MFPLPMALVPPTNNGCDAGDEPRSTGTKPHRPPPFISNVVVSPVTVSNVSPRRLRSELAAFSEPDKFSPSFNAYFSLRAVISTRMPSVFSDFASRPVRRASSFVFRRPVFVDENRCGWTDSDSRSPMLFFVESTTDDGNAQRPTGARGIGGRERADER